MRAGATLAALGLLALCGCGKADLHRAPAQHPPLPGAPGLRSATAPQGAPHRPVPAPGAQGEAVAIPLALTAARASAFARAVSLRRVDLPGAAPSPRSRTPASQEREAANCGGRAARAVGGGRSPSFQRGVGLDRESISSAVDVLSSAAEVRRDLAYAASRAGLACYSKVLGKSLRGETASRVRLLGVHVGHLGLDVGPLTRATGLQITARVGIAGTGVTVRLYIDALSLAYGPAELELYTTSFVQPVPPRTQRALLELLRARARLERL
ncbi:MAG: hypothetical protein QOK19_1109 [Solirubrobacteraceae bacterium]|nr:hypothetical protein [Solirubrobacteraceae bacterium]